MYTYEMLSEWFPQYNASFNGVKDSVDLILLGLDRQIQARTGIWRSPQSNLRST